METLLYQPQTYVLAMLFLILLMLFRDLRYVFWKAFVFASSCIALFYITMWVAT